MRTSEESVEYVKSSKDMEDREDDVLGPRLMVLLLVVELLRALAKAWLPPDDVLSAPPCRLLVPEKIEKNRLLLLASMMYAFEVVSKIEWLL